MFLENTTNSTFNWLAFGLTEANFGPIASVNVNLN